MNDLDPLSPAALGALEPLSREAFRALEAWDALPKGPQRRQPLLGIAARFPDQITIEQVGENSVRIHTSGARWL